LKPVRTAAHFEKPRLLRLETTVPACLHGEKMLQRWFLFLRIRVRHRAVGKETQDRLLHVANESLLDGQSDERGCDALRDRGHVVSHLRVVRIKVSIQHQLAVAYYLDTMHGYLVFADVIEHLGERSRIESNFFRQGRGPFGKLSFFRSTCSHVRTDAEREGEHGPGGEAGVLQ